MRKRILILLAVLAALVCICSLTAMAAEENTIVRYCEYCDLTETWYPLTNTSPMETKHYFLTNSSTTYSEKIIGDGVTVCLELNGFTYSGNRHMVLEKGAILNVQGEGGVLQCRGDNQLEDGTWEPGGCVWVKSGAKFNLYSGTLRFWSTTAKGASRGGAVAVYGEFNMYGGTLRDGVAKELGGTLYVDGSGKFNMYGGQILGGTAPNSPCVYNRGYILLVDDASVEHIQITPKSTSGILLADQLTIRGNYTGTLCLTCYNVADVDVDIGNSDGAILENGNIYFKNQDLKVRVSGTDLVTYLPDPVKITSGSTETAYTTLEEALLALKDGDTLALQQNVTGDLTIPENVTLELNGRNIAGTLTAAEGKTVYVKDSFTADYDIGDGVYGKITALAGDVKAVPATATSDPYLMITESKGVSFHAVGLNISGMTLKTGDAALYFNNTFAGDSLVKAQVASFGVAMSITGEPTEATMQNSKHYTKLEAELFGTQDGNNGSLLYGIMKEENGSNTNRKNAETVVYGKAYVQLTNGQYLFGICRSKDFKTQVEDASARIEKLSGQAQDGLMKLVERFGSITKDWSISEIYNYMENHEKETLKIMIVGNSGAVDAYSLLYQAYKDQYPDQKLVLGVMYYSGCTIKQHVNFYQNNSPVYSYRVNRDGTWVHNEESTLRDGLTDQQWDIVSMHAPKTSFVTLEDRNLLAQYIDDCVDNEYKLYFDYTWPNPNDETFFAPGYDPQPPAGYKDKLIENFDFDPVKQMKILTEHFQNDMLADGMFEKFVNCSPAILYAMNVLNVPQTELYRDYTHLSDFGRLIAAYCWVTQITGEPLTEVNVDVVPKEMRHRRAQAYGDMIVTEEMKQIIIEAANFALENRYAIPEPVA